MNGGKVYPKILDALTGSPHYTAFQKSFRLSWDECSKPGVKIAICLDRFLLGLHYCFGETTAWTYHKTVCIQELLRYHDGLQIRI